MANLYEITNEYQLALRGDSETGEIDVKLIDKIDQDFNKKAIALASHIKNQETEISAIMDAMDAMKLRITKLAKNNESLKKYLLGNMSRLGIFVIKESPYFVIKTRACPASLYVENPDLIPAKYFITKEVVSLSNSAIKDDLQKDISVPGASLIYNTTLSIK